MTNINKIKKGPSPNIGRCGILWRRDSIGIENMASSDCCWFYLIAIGGQQYPALCQCWHGMRVIRSVGPIYLSAATARSLSFPLQYHTAYTQILLFIQYVVASRVYLCWLLILHVATFKELNKLIPLRIREDIFGNGGIATLTGKSKLSQIAGRYTGKLTIGARPSFVLSYRRAGWLFVFCQLSLSLGFYFWNGLAVYHDCFTLSLNTEIYVCIYIQYQSDDDSSSVQITNASPLRKEMRSVMDADAPGVSTIPISRGRDLLYSETYCARKKERSITFRLIESINHRVVVGVFFPPLSLEKTTPPSDQTFEMAHQRPLRSPLNIGDRLYIRETRAKESCNTQQLDYSPLSFWSSFNDYSRLPAAAAAPSTQILEEPMLLRYLALCVLILRLINSLVAAG